MTTMRPKHKTKTTTTDYKKIRVLFPDHLGLARGKYIPTAHPATSSNHCIGIFALTFDRMMVPAPGGGMLEGLPDCKATFSRENVRPGWEQDTGVVIADLSFRGEPLAISPRHVLRHATDDWKKLGYKVKLGIELEAYVMQPDGHGGWKAWDTPGAFVYGTGPAVDPAGLFERQFRYSMISQHSQLPLQRKMCNNYNLPGMNWLTRDHQWPRWREQSGAFSMRLVD